MADADPPRPDDTARLEAALNRIARHRAVAADTAGPGAAPAIPSTLAARLDTLIADLRAVLGGASSD